MDEELPPAWEGVEAGLPQGDAAGVLLLLGFRLPLLPSIKSRDNQLSTVFTFQVQTLFSVGFVVNSIKELDLSVFNFFNSVATQTTLGEEVKFAMCSYVYRTHR